MGREPAGISFDVSCIRTLCQSANLMSCRSSAKAFTLWAHRIHTDGRLLPQKTLGPHIQLFIHTKSSSKSQIHQLTNLSVLELLLNILYNSGALQTLEKVPLPSPPLISQFQMYSIPFICNSINPTIQTHLPYHNPLPHNISNILEL